MPSPETSNLEQTAIYWESLTPNSYGELTLDTPIEIKVRWIKQATEEIDAKGNLIELDATAIVKQDIKENSLMWLGTLENWYSVGSSGDSNYSDDLMLVKLARATPDMRNRVSYRLLGLVRYRDRLST